MTRFSSILETVGNTPVVKINKLAPAGIDLYVKIEAFNPLGSVKDRLALGVIEDAERTGALKPGQTVIEATSGNTAIALAEKHGWFLTRQFENEANADMHSRTTAREIIDDFANERLDYWVTGFGTGGTLKGVARVLDKERPETRIVLAEPADAPIVSSGTRQERNADGSPAARHPAWKPHPIQGWSPDFLPKLTADALDAGYVDRVI